jgi:hypothetical protein
MLAEGNSHTSLPINRHIDKNCRRVAGQFVSKKKLKIMLRILFYPAIQAACKAIDGKHVTFNEDSDPLLVLIHGLAFHLGDLKPEPAELYHVGVRE